MKQKTWAEKAIIAVYAIIDQHPQLPKEQPAAYRKRIRAALDAGYPFMQRSGFAYKVWVREKMIILRRLGIKKTRKKKLSSDQLELFGDE